MAYILVQIVTSQIGGTSSTNKSVYIDTSSGEATQLPENAVYPSSAYDVKGEDGISHGEDRVRDLAAASIIGYSIGQYRTTHREHWNRGLYIASNIFADDESRGAPIPGVVVKFPTGQTPLPTPDNLRKIIGFVRAVSENTRDETVGQQGQIVKVLRDEEFTKIVQRHAGMLKEIEFQQCQVNIADPKPRDLHVIETNNQADLDFLATTILAKGCQGQLTGTQVVAAEAHEAHINTRRAPGMAVHHYSLQEMKAASAQPESIQPAPPSVPEGVAVAANTRTAPSVDGAPVRNWRTYSPYGKLTITSGRKQKPLPPTDGDTYLLGQIAAAMAERPDFAAKVSELFKPPAPKR